MKSEDGFSVARKCRDAQRGLLADAPQRLADTLLDIMDFAGEPVRGALAIIDGDRGQHARRKL